MNFITEYPLWFILFCLLAGGIYAFILYRKDDSFEDKASLKWLLGVFRFLSVAAISFFLLGPLLKSVQKTVEKPILVFAQDNSESITLNSDSSAIRNDYLNDFESLSASFEEDYQVLRYTFGESFSKDGAIDFSDKKTDISFLLEEVYNRFSNRNLGAVIVSSDGIYNQGKSPIYQSKKINVPFYTIALGDTTVKRDLILKDAAHNRLAYLGNSFPLEIIIQANDLKGSRSTLRISNEGKNVFQQEFSINARNDIQTIAVELEATKTGRQRFDLSLSPVEGEFITQNNYKSIYIDVLDSRQKVLLLADVPHPDLAAMKESILNNSNYEIDLDYANEFKGKVEDYQLLILHQLPSSKNRLDKLFSDAELAKIPMLFVLGQNNDYRNLANRELGFRLERFNQSANEVKAGFNNNFSLFKLEDNVERKLSKFPPLSAPFGAFSLGGNAENLFFQKIGQVNTSDPLFVFTEINEQKYGFIVGEGFWKWRMFDYLEHGDQEFSDNVLQKTVQYLAVRKDKRLFKVYGNSEFKENEPILLDAELYNESYEAINDPDVEISFKNEEGLSFDFTFSKTANGYRLNAGNLPSGDYSYVASTEVNNQVLSSTGRISVLEVLAELSNTTANHRLLYNLAENSNGKMYSPTDLDALKNEILAKEEITSVSYTRQSLSELINLKWPFFILLLLLSVEWFLRKRNGAY
ncbi:MAG: hypothetical protein AAF487_07735 [Bacteroidota bacterium]